MATIGHVRRQAEEAIPHKVHGGTVISDVFAGARRKWGKPPDRKVAADGDVIWAMLHAIKGNTLKDVRDRALLPFGMVSCMRRFEIAALDMSDLHRAPEALRVIIHRSKSDQDGAGAVIAEHSLRVGFLTSAAWTRASIWKVQEQSRHNSLNVLSDYVRSARLFEDYAGKDFA